MSALNLKACNIFKQDFFNQSVQLGNNLTFYALRALRDLAMKKIIAVMAIGLMMLSMSVSADAARRFGGGMSFGRSAPTLQQKAAPAAPNHLNQQKAAPQQQQRQQAAPNQTQRPQPQAASPMRGMLMGLAAALGITALAHALGLGDAFASFVMMALVAIVAFYAIRFLMGFLFFLVSVNISALELKPIQTCTPGTVEYKPEGSCDTTSRKCCGGSGLLGFWSEWGEGCTFGECDPNSKPRLCYVENGSCTIKDCNCVSGKWECTKNIICDSGYILNGGVCKSMQIIPPSQNCLNKACNTNVDCSLCGNGWSCVQISTGGPVRKICQRGLSFP